MWGLKKIREFAFIHFSLGTQRERYRSWVNAFTFKTSINMEIPQTTCFQDSELPDVRNESSHRTQVMAQISGQSLFTTCGILEVTVDLATIIPAATTLPIAASLPTR